MGHPLLVGTGSVDALPPEFGASADLNNAGQIPGVNVTTRRATVYSDGKLMDIDIPDGTEESASAINNAGEVVGYFLGEDCVHGFLHKAGVVSDIGGFGGTFTYPWSINDSGQIGKFELARRE